MKKALLLCASHNDLGLIWSLRKLGYYILATGNVPGLIGERYVDEYIKADYSDKELILQIAAREKVDVICHCCNDFGVYTAAYVAEKLGLPGYDSYETTLTLNNKDRFKQFAREHRITTPRARPFTDPRAACDYAADASYPIIIKPVDCSAGNGIHRAENPEEVGSAIRQAFEKSRAGRIVIEPYITGSQHGFCTFLHDQRVAAYCSNNEYSIVNPYRVEIDTFPADNDGEVSAVLIEQIERMARALSLHDGIFHLQYIMDGDGTPQIIEVMRRAIGNMYWYPAGLITGFDWNYWEVRARCGLSCAGVPTGGGQEGYYAYKTILAPGNGTIKSVSVPGKYRKYLVDSVMLKRAGDSVSRYESEPVGFLFLAFRTRDEMKQTLIAEYDNSLVEMDL